MVLTQAPGQGPRPSGTTDTGAPSHQATPDTAESSRKRRQATGIIVRPSGSSQGTERTRSWKQRSINRNQNRPHTNWIRDYAGLPPTTKSSLNKSSRWINPAASTQSIQQAKDKRKGGPKFQLNPSEPTSAMHKGTQRKPFPVIYRGYTFHTTDMTM